MTTPELDPSIWKQMTEWLWAGLLIPVGALWKKVDGSASKTELKESVASIGATLDRHFEDDKMTRKEIRETQAEVFKRLDSLATTVTKIDTTLTLKLDDLQASKKK